MRAFIFTFALCGMIAAQQPQPKIVSPEISSAGRVTFRLRDPNAQKVVANIAGAAQPLALQKDADGIWSATSEAMAPDLYSYSFDADGVRLLDPNNPAIVLNLLAPSNFLHVSGASPQIWDGTDIRHGEIHHHFYHSQIVGDDRDFYVYTPPGYDPHSKMKYPVLYLLHGYSDAANGWTEVGHANFILDSLIKSGQAKPMLIVMPLGYGDPTVLHPPPGTQAFGGELRDRNFSNFTAALLKEVIPTVEKNCSVNANREARAIAGLSMGGAETLLTGLNHLDKFAWIASFSAGGMGDNFDADFKDLNSAANSKLKLLWVACGTEDRLITINRNLVAWLKAKDIHVTPVETPGMHTWMVWRRNLQTIAPMLFQ